MLNGRDVPRKPRTNGHETTMTTETAPGAMTGLRVIDLTRVLGGPYCTQILADHGAEVIKVEPPAGDEVRDWGPPFHGEDAAYFVGINRNKRSIGLDLASEGGRAVLMKMLESADVLIENFKPGTLDKWGIGYDVLRAIPQTVHCRISGFGADGPLGGFPGYDAIIQAMTGMISITGTADSGPTRLGNPIVDIATGLFSTIGILMALQERAKSGGLGQYVDMTLHDCGMALLHPHAANFFLNGKRPKADWQPASEPGALFRNSAPAPARSSSLPATIRGLPQARQGDRQARTRHRSALCPQQGPHRQPRRAARRTRRRVQPARRRAAVRPPARGRPAGGPGAVDRPGADQSAHTLHRGDVIEKDWYKGVASPIRLERTKPSLRRTPPKFSQHTAEVLGEFGYSKGEIEALVAKGAVCGSERKR